MFTALLLFLAWGAAPARAYTLNSNDPNMHGWKTDVLKVNLSLSDCPSEVDLPSIVLDAMKVWNEVDGLNIKLQLNNVASTTSAQKARAGEAKDAPVIACDPSFGTDTTMDPAIVPGVGGVAVSSSNEEIIYGYVILNTQPNTLANIESLDRNRLTIVVAHELGHLLGLGHSTDPQALMFPNVTNLTRAALAQDDLNGIWHLYGPGATRESTPGCGTISNKLPPDEYDTHIGAFLFTALLCGVGLRLMRGSRAID